jgi:hypothetical protein
MKQPCLYCLCALALVYSISSESFGQAQQGVEVVSSSGPVGFAQEIGKAGRLYVGAQYTLAASASKFPMIPRSLAGTKWETTSPEEVPYTGTYWPVFASGETLYVTAKHVVLPPLPTAILNEPIDGTNSKIVGVETRAYLGRLAEVVGSVGIVDNLQDVAFLRPERSAAFIPGSPFSFATNAPRVGEVVQVFGFPSESGTHSAPTQQIEEYLIASVHEDQGYFTLNRPVNAGFSGGPVVNSQNGVYGVVSCGDTNNTQTTVMRLKQDHLASIHWKPMSEFGSQSTGQE